MSRFLAKDVMIIFTDINEKKKFRVDDIIGVGGSCIAYKVTYYENDVIPHTGILKEYCPAFLEDGFSRTGTSINIPDDKSVVFEAGLEEFKNTYRCINEYLANNLTATNFHTVQLGLYEGNNTAYTLSACDYGMSYDKIDDDNLLSIFKIVLSVTKAVELYHNAGFLHLDIKPKNVLVLDEVTDLIKLFDFDSLTSMQKLKSRQIHGVPVPEDYYVPELDSYNIGNIGVETDVFEIGAMLFLRVFNRAPNSFEMSYDAKFNFDNNELFAGVSPQAQSEISDLFKHTIQTSKRNRYKTTGILINQIKKIISLLSEEKPYLIDLPKWQPSKFCIGRTDELKEIKKRLDNDGYVFIKGIGGLGKSEITKLFTQKYANQFHTVQFCKYNDDLKNLVAAIQIKGIEEQNYTKFEDLVNAKNKILHLSDDKTLIIVDNFNVTYDDFLRDFLPSNNKSFKVIFTTRCSMASEYYESKTFELEQLSINECKQLFINHSGMSIDFTEEELLENIIEFIDGNTLVLILMANLIKKSKMSLNDMFASFEDQTIVNIEDKLFHEYDFSSEEVSAYNKIYSHLKTIFSISKLTVQQKRILKNATLISPNGINLNEFIEHCCSESINKDSVAEILALGWMNEDNNSIVSMHPIISDLLAIDDNLTKDDSFESFSEYLEDFCNPDYCHITVVLNKLACAKHLERRYVFEENFKKTVIAAKLGRMYQCVYQPENAKKYLNKALGLTDDSHTIIMIYRFLGDVEKDFGLRSRAIDYYKKSVDEGKKLKNRFYLTNTESMLKIAECYADNNDNIEAYNAYLEALNYAKIFNIYELIYDIAIGLADVCGNLDWIEKANKYTSVAEKYKKFSHVIEELPGISDFSNCVENGDFTGGLEAYEKFLAKQRETIGEESPMYKDLKSGLWVFYAINDQKEQALFLLNESLEFIRSTSGEVSMEMASKLVAASSIMVKLAEFGYAETFAKRAMSICEELSDTHAYAYVEAKLSLATLSLLLGDEAQALKYVEEIDFEEYSGNEYLSDVVGYAGFVLVQLSKFDIITPLCIDLLNRQNSDFTGKFLANLLLSMIYEQQGLFSESELYAENAKEQISYIKTESIKNDWLVQYYRAQARIQFRKANYQEAINILDNYLGMISNQTKKGILASAVYSDRGLYYQSCGKLEKAKEDYSICESILKENNFPETAFCTLYNNIALNYEKACDYKNARHYLKKIIRIRPSVLTPTSYFEGLVCNNYAWIELKLSNIDNAISLFSNVINLYEELKMTKTKDYLYALNNMAIAYGEKENYNNSLQCYKIIREHYNPDVDLTGELAKYTTNGIILALLELNRANEAYEFACNEVKNYEKWFGTLSSVRVEEIIKMGGFFRQYGFNDCEDFFELADDLIFESEDYESINYAMLLNYLGVCATDYHQKHCKAERFFNNSKELFEKLNATDDEMYSIVLNNLEYIKDLALNELLQGLVNYTDDESEE